jgi:hypothetical protein
MMEARAGFRQLNAYRQLPAVRHALAERQCSTIPKARGRVQDCPEPLLVRTSAHRVEICWTATFCAFFCDRPAEPDRP